MALTPELLERLNLDDTSREVLQREIAEQETRNKHYDELRKNARADGVKSRITALSEMPEFTGKQGFLRYIEQTLLSDDGDAAIRLDLADGSQPQVLTVTQVIDGMISTLAGSKDPSETQLSQSAHLLDNPLDRRPPEKPEPAGDENKPMTGDELLEQWRKAAPEAVTELAMPATSTGNGA